MSAVLLSIFFNWAIAQDVYMIEMEDGTLKFTDSPDHDGYVLFNVNGPPPKSSNVNNKNFPNLNRWDHYLSVASQNYDLPLEFLKAICIAESGMNPNAKSNVGAMGLMQLMPGTAKDLRVTDPWDPEQNIDGGSRYIRQQLDDFGEYRLAVAAYHAGPGNVRKYNGIPPFQSTQTYVKRVMELYTMFLEKNNSAEQVLH